MSMNGKHKLYENVLSRLLNVVYLYKRSTSYNYIPDSTVDGWVYFSNLFYEIETELNQNLRLSQREYETIQTIILEIKSFVRSFSGVNGLAQRYFDANPNLRFFDVAYGIQEASDELFYMAAAKKLLGYVPKIKDFHKKDNYFNQMYKVNKENNFNEDEDDFLMAELAYALREVFLKELCN